MTGSTLIQALRLLAVLGLLAPSWLTAQGRGIDFTYGRWWHGGTAQAFTAALYRPFFGPFDYGVGLTHLDDSRSADDRTQTGGELSLGLGRDGSGLYLVAASDLAMRHRDRNVDAAWSAGAGYAVRPLSFVSLALEARYRVEDRNVRGFWQLGPLDRRGLMLQARVALGSTGRGGRGAPGSGRPTPQFDAPSDADLARAASRGGSSEETARLSVEVVKTALDAMGTPYRWGGSGENGYDCSGLIQYAYGEHGLLLPRVSHDQVRLGTLVPKDVEALRPGDILGFAISGGGVSHVGLYVGDGTFIHSSSSGVKLSSLTASDADSRYWRQRWMVTRRILN